MYVKYFGIWSVFILPSNLFLKLISNKNFNEKLNISLVLTLFSKKQHKFFYMANIFKIFYFLNKLYFKESPLKTGFYLLLDLIGLGFRIIKVTERLFYFELG